MQYKTALTDSNFIANIKELQQWLYEDHFGAIVVLGPLLHDYSGSRRGLERYSARV
jgi:hypothetical protein